MSRFQLRPPHPPKKKKGLYHMILQWVYSLYTIDLDIVCDEYNKIFTQHIQECVDTRVSMEVIVTS